MKFAKVATLFLLLFAVFSIEPDWVLSSPCGPNEPSCDTVQNCEDGNGFVHSVICKYVPPPPVGCNFSNAPSSVMAGDYIRYIINIASGTLTEYYTSGDCFPATAGTGDPGTPPYCFAGMGLTPRCGGHTRARNFPGSCTVHAGLSDGNSCNIAVTILEVLEPNLQVTEFSVPDGSVGQSVNARVRVRNAGSWQTGPLFEVAVNRNLAGGMLCTSGEHGRAMLTTLQPGETTLLTIPITLPNSTGTFSAKAMADSDCQIAESNENDNTRADTYQVSSACTPVLPSVNLFSPADGAVLPSRTEVNLDWNQNFGAVCPLPNPGDIAHLKITDSISGAVVFNNDVGTSSEFSKSDLICGQEYLWQVKVTNGVEEVSSDEWSFTTASCLPPSSNGFFSTFGGGVLAASGDLANSNVPAGRFISENLASQPLSAGVVSGHPLNTIEGGGGYSEQGFNLTSYETSGAERNGADYETLLSNALKAGGFSANNISEVCGSDPVMISGQEVRFSCWSGGSLTGALEQALGDLTKIQIIVPQDQFSAFQKVVLSDSQLTVNGKHIVVFVPTGVSVTNEVVVGASNDSTLTVVSTGDLTFGLGLNRVDGSFVTGGKFSDGENSDTRLFGMGQILAFGNVSLYRNVIGQAAEEISYHGKYLAALWHIFAKPKVTWTEVSPK